MRHGGLAALLGIALAVSSDAGTLDDLARELPRIKPLEPAAALSSFRIHAGFHLEQVAVEPMVINPVSAATMPMGGSTWSRCAAIPIPRRHPRGAWPGSRTATETDGSTRGPSLWTAFPGRRARTLAAAEIDPDRLEQLRHQKDPQLRRGHNDS